MVVCLIASLRPQKNVRMLRQTFARCLDMKHIDQYLTVELIDYSDALRATFKLDNMHLNR
jgi:hypothetical protein